MDTVALGSCVADIEVAIKLVKLADVAATVGSALIVHVSPLPIHFPLAKLNVHNLISLYIPLNTKPTALSSLQL